MNTLRSSLFDIIFPRRCLGCDILLEEESRSYLCHPCLKAMPFTKGFACAFCKSPVRTGKTCVYCIKNHYLDRLLVATSYENPLVKKVLKAIKYRFVKSLAVDMADLMIKYLKKRVGWLMSAGAIEIVPVPLHRQRLNWRGFNQAEIMAQEIAKSFSWSLAANTLKRVSNQRPQADMPNKLSRIENMHEVFKFQGPSSINLINYRSRTSIIGTTILLIDDISTTGSTLNDCARALKGAGAKEVIGFVFARGKLDKK